MKIFHFIKSKLSAVTSKLADTALKAVINSEIAKGKNPLQTLCDEAARLKQQLAVANESLKQSMEIVLRDDVKKGNCRKADR